MDGSKIGRQLAAGRLHAGFAGSSALQLRIDAGQDWESIKLRYGSLYTVIDLLPKERAGQVEGISAHDFPALFLVETEYRLTLLKAEQAFVADLVRRIERGWGPLELWRGFHENRGATLEKLYRQYGGGPMT